MIEPLIFESYLTRHDHAVPTVNSTYHMFENPLHVSDVQTFDTTNYYFQECLLNTGMFSGELTEELKKQNYVRSGLLFLSNIPFNLREEIQAFKKRTGVIRMGHAAALYIGGMYHLHKTEQKLVQYSDYRAWYDGSNPGKDLSKTVNLGTMKIGNIERDMVKRLSLNELAEKSAMTTGLGFEISGYTVPHGYGVANNLYEEWTKFVKGSYIGDKKSDPTNTSVLQLGNWTNQFKTFLTGNSKWGGQKDFKVQDFTHHATYSVLQCKMDFMKEADKPSGTYFKSFTQLIASVKSQVKYGKMDDEILTFIQNQLKKANVFRENLEDYAGKVEPITSSDDVEVAKGILRTAADEVSKEVSKYSDNDFMLALYPSGGGLFNNGTLYANNFTPYEGIDVHWYDWLTWKAPTAGAIVAAGLDEDYDGLSAVKEGGTTYISAFEKGKDMNPNLAVNVYNRSLRFVWAQPQIDWVTKKNDPVFEPNNIHRSIYVDETVKLEYLRQLKIEYVMQKSTYKQSVGVVGGSEEYMTKPVPLQGGVFGKLIEYTKDSEPTYDNEAHISKTPIVMSTHIQNIISEVGLHNMEYLEQHFLDWASEGMKDQFTDSFHFTTLLKSIMLLEKDDFSDITLKVNGEDKTFTASEQIAMLYGYDYVLTKSFKNDLSHHLLNVFLTNAQHTKIAKVFDEFRFEPFYVNNFTLLGELSCSGVTLQIDKAPFRREAILGAENLPTGFLTRKFIFGDQDLSGFDVADVKKVANDPTNKTHKLIAKYYNFQGDIRGTGIKIQNNIRRVLDFCKAINVSPNDERILRLLIPFVGSFNPLSVDAAGAFAAWEREHITRLSGVANAPNDKLWPYVTAYLKAYKEQLQQLTTKEGADSLISKDRGDKDVLLDYKQATYYNIRALYDNNLYVPKNSFNGNLADTKYTSMNFRNEPLFYNYVNYGGGDMCGEPAADMTKDGKRPKHLYEYVKILDRSNRNVGTDILANLKWLKEEYFGLKGDAKLLPAANDMLTSNTYASFFSTFAGQHNSLVHPLSSWMNLAGTQENGEDLFGTYTTLEKIDGSPSFIIQYIGDIESVLGSKQNKNTVFGDKQKTLPQNSFCMDVDFKNGQPIAKAEEVPADIRGGEVACFVVDFTSQHQQVFKNIQIDTSQFTNTEESIKSYVDLVSNQHKQQPASGDLFKILTQRSYSCQVDALGNVMIQPLSYFYLKNIPLFQGTYWIVNVSHKIENNTMTTTFKGVRQPIATIPSRNEMMLRIMATNQKTVKAITDSATTNGNSPEAVANGVKFLDFEDPGYVGPYAGGNIDSATKNHIMLVMYHLQFDSVHKFTYMQAAAITGHLIQESGLNPKAVNKKNSKLPTGLAQWTSTGGRRDRMLAFVGDLESQTPEQLIKKQLQFLDEELKDPYYERITTKPLKSAKTMADALLAFAKFEGFNDSGNRDALIKSLKSSSGVGEWGDRVKFARQVMGAKYPDLLTEQAIDAGGDGVRPGSAAPTGVPKDINQYVLDAYKNNASFNGRLDTSKLTRINDAVVTIKPNCNHPYMHPKAAKKLEELAKFVQQNGLTMSISDAYRTYETQEALRKKYGTGKAAKPGTSNHGWGIAVDISELYQAAGGSISPEVNREVRSTSKLYALLDQHAAKFGFYNPDKLQDGKGSDEVWHWEYHEA